MFKIVPYPGHPDWDRLFAEAPSYEVDPNAEFDPSVIKQLSVVGCKVCAPMDEEDEPEKPEESE